MVVFGSGAPSSDLGLGLSFFLEGEMGGSRVPCVITFVGLLGLFFAFFSWLGE